jgi:HEPN domain-containing protein
MSEAGSPIAGLRPLPRSSNPVVEEWIAKAAADMETASREAVVTGVHANYDAVCFHAQQAIEKLMKAVLIAHGLMPPFTHDLSVLAGMLTERLGEWPHDSKDLRPLTLGAVQYRYPGMAASHRIRWMY